MTYWIVSTSGSARAHIDAQPTKPTSQAALRAEIAARHNNKQPMPARVAKDDAERAIQRANYARTKGNPERTDPPIVGDRLLIESDDKPEADAFGPYTAQEAAEVLYG